MGWWGVKQIPLFKSIVMDPPWKEPGGNGKGSNDKYQTINHRQMPTIIAQSPLWRPDLEGCSVWCWTTVTSIAKSFRLLDSLGVDYVTHWIWEKTKAEPTTLAHLMTDSSILVSGVVPDLKVAVLRNRKGMGQRQRTGHEVLLYGRVGSVPRPPTGDRPDSVFHAPTGRHSEKPDAGWRVIEQHDQGAMPRAELFCRKPRPGWWGWGHVHGFKEAHVVGPDGCRV